MKITRVYEFNDEFIQRLRSYGERNWPGWGNLHIAMEDGNLEDSHLDWCKKHATEEKDTEGAYLAEKILELTDEARGVLYDEF